MLDVVVRQGGGGCGDHSDGDVIALAATKAGGGQRNESGRGQEEVRYLMQERGKGGKRRFKKR